MRVLVLGSGAKDHAIAWWFSKSRYITALFMAPGNFGTEHIATNLPDVDPADPQAVLAACRKYCIDFVFAGTEAPLFSGVLDLLKENGIRTFGATSNVLRIEGDRNFARQFAEKHSIPTPKHRLFTTPEDLSDFLKSHEGTRFVLKSNEIAPSRIMIESTDYDALMDFAQKMFEKSSVLLEECIEGLPITITLILDNKGYSGFPLCSEYTKTDSVSGIPTGGMGAICPVPLKDDVSEQIIDKVIKPTIEGMKEDGLAYKGVLTISAVLNEKQGPVVVDYHVRFNDPAAQSIIPLVKTDIVELLEAMENNTIKDVEIQYNNKSSVAVVLASPGYPQKPETGIRLDKVYTGFYSNEVADVPNIFCGSIERNEKGIFTSGGRCLTVVGTADNIINANRLAYNALEFVKIDGCWSRSDIGNKFFENSEN